MGSNSFPLYFSTVVVIITQSGLVCSFLYCEFLSKYFIVSQSAKSIIIIACQAITWLQRKSNNIHSQQVS